MNTNRYLFAFNLSPEKFGQYFRKHNSQFALFEALQSTSRCAQTFHCLNSLIFDVWIAENLVLSYSSIDRRLQFHIQVNFIQGGTIQELSAILGKQLRGVDTSRLQTRRLLNNHGFSGTQSLASHDCIQIIRDFQEHVARASVSL